MWASDHKRLWRKPALPASGPSLDCECPMRDEQFERMYQANAASLFSFLAYRTGDRALAEDLLADTFERALRKRTLFDGHRGSEKTWLYAIAVNRLRDHLKKTHAEERSLERVQMLTPAAERAPEESIAERSWITWALSQITTEERDVVALRFGGELTCTEIAKVLREPVTTVEGRLYRSLRKLRDELG